MDRLGVSNRLPENNNTNEDEDNEDVRVLNIGELHLHANEIDSIRRLAETDPDLAKIVVEQKGEFDKREHASYRFGVISTVFLVLGVLASLSYVLVQVGVLLSLALVFCILAIALLIRVILTGEWSDTSWVGHIVNGIVKLFGGNPRAEDND